MNLVLMSNDNKFYILNMFPYPSGDGLHVGHGLGYIASDIYSRYKKMCGYDVINPIGFDSFGLPAEQYAIQTGQHPAITTQKNIERYIDQMKKMDLSFDWNRMIITSDNKYYKWTQWIFIQMFNSFYCLVDDKAHKIEDLYIYFSQNGSKNVFEYAFCDREKIQQFTSQEWNKFNEEERYKISLKFRIAYIDDIEVNWCEELKTVLANDEIVNGVSERGGYPVIKKKMKQWCLKITAYAERLLNRLNYNNNTIVHFNHYVKPNVPIVLQNIVNVIVKHNDEFLLIEYKNNDALEFITGNIDCNETPEQIAVKKLKENTGYTNIKYVKNLNIKIDSFFYQGRKDINKHNIIDNIVIELNDKTNSGVNNCNGEEQTVIWVKSNKVRNMLSNEGMVYVYDYYNIFFSCNCFLEWPEATKQMQRNWICKSQGAIIKFKTISCQDNSKDVDICVYTTHQETVYGVTFLAISKQTYINICLQLKIFAQEINFEENGDKQGFLAEFYSINPFNQDKIPVYVTNYVIEDYGTGAVMGVPGHDQRDNEFAKKYNIKIKQVINQNNIMLNSDFLNGLEQEDAKKKIIEVLENKNIGYRKINYKLHDSIFSRQRYWGEPIPIYYKNNLPYVIDEEDLPLVLPDIDDYTPTGEPPLCRAKNWTYICRKDNKEYKLETNTMPSWAGSSWYFLRYLDPHNNEKFCSIENMNKWNNVDLYIGGAEHSTGHLLYARFYTKFLYDLGYINFDEPFKKLIHQGMILGKSAIIYRKKNSNTYISANLRNKINDDELISLHIPSSFVISEDEKGADIFPNINKLIKWNSSFGGKNADYILVEDYHYSADENSEKTKMTHQYNKAFFVDILIEKMSKSKFNVINPDDVIDKYSSDVLRLYLMFLGPIEQQKPWDTKGIEGVNRFIRNIKLLGEKIVKITDEKTLNEQNKIINVSIKKVQEDIEKMSFNTAISSMMICYNNLSKYTNVDENVYKNLLLLLYPFTPRIAKELLDKYKLIENDDLKFPEYDEKYIVENNFKYPIMINGKTRTFIEFNIDKDEGSIKREVLNNEKVKKWIEGRIIKNFIIVKKKIISIVV